MSWGVDEVLARLRDGAVLHRLASEREGVCWFLMPEQVRIPEAVAETVASAQGVVRDGAQVGRVSLKFEVREQGVD